jgi:hypothetical protein
MEFINQAEPILALETPLLHVQAEMNTKTIRGKTSNSRGQALTEYVILISIISFFLLSVGFVFIGAFEKYISSIVFLINLPIP